MARQQPVALVFAGPVSRGTLGRLPGLRQHLTWVKSSSIPTASRAVHALGCGSAVGTYHELRTASLFLVTAPSAFIPTLVQELASSELAWHRRIVVLYDSACDSSVAEPLRKLGAETATLTYHARPEQFLAEGTPEALRQIRLLTGNRPLIRLRSHAEYWRAMRLTTEDFFALFAAASEGFVRAGMTKTQADNTISLMITESARSWLRAGKRLLKTRTVKPRV